MDFELSFEPPDWKKSLGFFLTLPATKEAETYKTKWLELPPLPNPRPADALNAVVSLANGADASSGPMQRGGSWSMDSSPEPDLGLADDAHDSEASHHLRKKVRDYEKALQREREQRESLERQAEVMAAKMVELQMMQDGDDNPIAAKSSADKLAAGKRMMRQRRLEVQSGSESENSGSAKSPTRQNLLAKVNALKNR